MRQIVTSKPVLFALLFLQFIPLIMFPPESYNAKNQEWWLPVLLAILSVIAVARLFIRYDNSLWPWYLMSFSQGFNIISRLMMFMPHATKIVNKETVIDSQYLIIMVISILVSTFMLWYMEQPEVRIILFKHKAKTI
jgi:putative effector of murein hydrolase LrgA (UPF0299 family)